MVGPVTAKKLLLEAKWATDAYAAVKNMPLEKQMQHMSQVHMLAATHQNTGWHVKQNWRQRIEQQPWRRGGSQDSRVHLLLGSKPLAPVAKVYEEVFHHILGQKVSKAAPNLALADRQLRRAEDTGRPILFVIHRECDNSRGYEQWLSHVPQSRPSGVPLVALVREYIVILLPLKELPALSHRLGQPPFAAPDRGTPLFVVARSTGEQVYAVTGWHNDQRLIYALADGYVDFIRSQPPSIKRLRNAQRLLKRIDQRFFNEMRDIIAKIIEEKKAARNNQVAQLSTD